MNQTDNSSSIGTDDIFPIDDISHHRFPYDNLNGIYHTPTSFNMITDTVAIGDWTSSYEPFDVIFNFNYPGNRARDQQIHRSSVFHKNKEKIIYTIGLYDTNYYNEALLNIFINLLPHLKIDKNKRILFHCYAGISRSSTAAILYFMISTHESLPSIYKMIVDKRPHINPNPAFRKILNICNTNRHIIQITDT